MLRIALLLAACVLANTASAQCPQCGQYHPPYSRTVKVDIQVGEALAEVNQARRRRGLRPFIYDARLTEAARRCAIVRARSRTHGHTANDFRYLPPGARARAAGCGANSPTWGWTTCCTYDNYRYAGAAWAWGSDGRRYMHLFVR